MNINIINDLPSIQSAESLTDDLAVSDDLFQQLLQFNNQSFQDTDKLSATVKPAVNSDNDETEDLAVNPDMVAMIMPLLDQQVVAPSQLLTVSSPTNVNEQLNNRLLTTHTTLLNEFDQIKAKLPIDFSIATQSTPIINQQLAPSVLSTVLSSAQLTHNPQPQLAKATQSALNHQLIEADIETATATATKPFSVIALTLAGEPSLHSNYTESVSTMVAKTNFPDDHLATTTDSKPQLITTHAVNAFMPDNHVQISSSSSVTMPQTLNLSMPVNINQWQTSLTQQIVMLTRQNIPTAEIKLHPQELGSLHIKLSMHDDKINLHLLAAHATVKGVLESALPLLKTSLEQQGITLQQADVSDSSMMNDSQQSPMFQQSKTSKPTKLVLTNEEPELETPLSQTQASAGLSIFA
ncbi:hypothetical protein A9G13_00840 [Gilliamella sp. wkB178]|uniref:flagellar hook-length control protein FliK n=1 Tax=Gilliamella sp. wkB178 TaxID=3120259 RepID=UPI00080E0064|nr:flagellar hook-length control protein FliK [Gilliamella apicola]OCG10317.1 hypothetical protein A9G13_00840 [Gilliamella apicola]